MTHGTDTITTIHIALLILLALAVVAAIAWGVRLSRAQARGQKEFEAHAEEAGVPIADADTPVPPPPAVSPSPPPLTDQSAAGTPSDTRPIADAPIAAAVDPDGTASSLADGPATRLKGLGPKVAARLGELGIDRIGQIAALDDAGVAALDAQLGPFAGRIVRDRWVEQARLLANGDRAGFERIFGKL